MSGINIRKTQDCYQNLFCNMVPILHIATAFMKPSLWLIIPLQAVSIWFAALFYKEHSQSWKFLWLQSLLHRIWKYIYEFRKINHLICNGKCYIMLKNNSVQLQLCRGNLQSIIQPLIVRNFKFKLSQFHRVVWRAHGFNMWFDVFVSQTATPFGSFEQCTPLIYIDTDICHDHQFWSASLSSSHDSLCWT